jgi:hypothetical protein
MDVPRPARRILAATGAALTLMGPARARADEAPPGEDEAQLRFGVGAGFSFLHPMGPNTSAQGSFAVSAWAAIPLTRHLQLTPSLHTYRVNAYGSGLGRKSDLSLGLEYVVAWRQLRVVPGLSFSRVQNGVVTGEHRGFGLGASLALLIPVTGPLELFGRADYRVVATSEEGIGVAHFVAGPALNF